MALNPKSRKVSDQDINESTQLMASLAAGLLKVKAGKDAYDLLVEAIDLMPKDKQPAWLEPFVDLVAQVQNGGINQYVANGLDGQYPLVEKMDPDVPGASHFLDLSQAALEDAVAIDEKNEAAWEESEVEDPDEEDTPAIKAFEDWLYKSENLDSVAAPALNYLYTLDPELKTKLGGEAEACTAYLKSEGIRVSASGKVHAKDAGKALVLALQWHKSHTSTAAQGDGWRLDNLCVWYNTYLDNGEDVHPVLEGYVFMAPKQSDSETPEWGWLLRSKGKNKGDGYASSVDGAKKAVDEAAKPFLQKNETIAAVTDPKDLVGAAKAAIAEMENRTSPDSIKIIESSMQTRELEDDEELDGPVWRVDLDAHGDAPVYVESRSEDEAIEAAEQWWGENHTNDSPEAVSSKKVYDPKTAKAKASLEETHLEYIDPEANSDKFYDIEPQEDGTVKIRWGRSGTKGQEAVFSESDAAKKLKEKLKKGYRKVAASVSGPSSEIERCLVCDADLEGNESIEDGVCNACCGQVTASGEGVGMKRDAMMSLLKKMKVSVVRTSEDFSPEYRGGIWVGLEDGALADYDLGHQNEIDDILDENGWWLEPIDGGTAIIWPTEADTKATAGADFDAASDKRISQLKIKYPKVWRGASNNGDFDSGLNSVSIMKVKDGTEFVFIETPGHGWIYDMAGEVAGEEDGGFDGDYAKYNDEIKHVFKTMKTVGGIDDSVGTTTSGDLKVSDLNVGDQLEIDWDGRLAPVEVIEKGDGGAYITLLKNDSVSYDREDTLFLKDDEHLPDAKYLVKKQQGVEFLDGEQGRQGASKANTYSAAHAAADEDHELYPVEAAAAADIPKGRRYPLAKRKLSDRDIELLDGLYHHLNRMARTDPKWESTQDAIDQLLGCKGRPEIAKSAAFGVSGVHLIKYPSGRWGFAGTVPMKLAYAHDDGTPLSEAEAKELSEASIPAMYAKSIKAKSLSWPDKESALKAAKDAGVSVAHSPEAATAAGELYPARLMPVQFRTIVDAVVGLAADLEIARDDLKSAIPVLDAGTGDPKDTAQLKADVSELLKHLDDALLAYEAVERLATKLQV